MSSEQQRGGEIVEKSSINPFDTLRDELSEIIRSVVREELREFKAEQSKAAQPVAQEDDRLVGREEIARRLDITPDVVTAKMGRGELVWTIDPISGQRKMKKSWLDAYIRDMPAYRGLLSARKEAVA